MNLKIRETLHGTIPIEYIVPVARNLLINKLCGQRSSRGVVDSNSTSVSSMLRFISNEFYVAQNCRPMTPAVA